MLREPSLSQLLGRLYPHHLGAGLVETRYVSAVLTEALVDFLIVSGFWSRVLGDLLPNRKLDDGAYDSLLGLVLS